jgi:DNA polymerase-3 subunit beta
MHPLLGGVLVETVDEGLLLTATDLELTTRVKVAAEVQEDGQMVLPTARLTDLVARLSGELSFEETETAVTVRQGKSHFSVKKMRVQDFPAGQDATGTALTISGVAWKKTARRVGIAASSSQIRPQYAGVLVRAGAASVTMVGFDTYRLAVEKIAANTPDLAGTAEEIVIPFQAMREIESMLGDDDDLTITWPASEMYMGKFEAPRFSVVTRLIDSKFPNFEKHIPKPVDCPLVIDRDRLIAALARAQLYTVQIRDDKDKLTLNAVVAFEANGQELIIEAESDEGNLHDVLLLEKPVEPKRKKFTASYLAAPLKFLGPTVELHFTTGHSIPAIYREGDYLYMLQPINDVEFDVPGGN